ncbi:efflux RND transporter periplasmic adaptor subunit [Lunatimonas salinarum]|uniref:efflux RND transporter periplasmic adaptor subunit n=1 Tax=Lunatimonas salinarum TaxID=1774590 RepID=UPI001ADFE664|nr:efflux RND transporter periplasmic adaptor subunit [Lunatimonas salinarum]
MKKLVIMLLTLIGSAAIAYTLYSNKTSLEEEAELAMVRSEFIPVTLERAKLLSADRSFESNGKFEAFQELTVMAEASGKVVEIGKKKGDYVRKGDLLVRLDDRLIRAEHTIATLNLEQYENDLKRFTNLAETDAVTKKQLEDIDRGVKIAAAQVEAIGKRMEDTRIVAPIDGYLNEDYYEPGTLINPGMPVADIINKSPLKLSVRVSEEEVIAISKGQTVKVAVNALPQQSLEGTVDFISDKADAAFRYEVIILVQAPNDSPVKPGMFGTAQFGAQAEQEVLVISRKAVSGGLKNPGVFTVKDGKAAFKSVEVRPLNATQVEVLAGLQAGEEIIGDGLINIKEGTPVQIR